MTPEQQFLFQKAQRSLAAAQQLMQQGFYDFAVSRAYYAMFYVAEALLDHEGLSFSSHAAVISAFGQTFAKAGKLPSEFHRQLIDAQAQRTRADYDPNPELSEEDAETLIMHGQAFLEAGQQYLA
ncbi:MAG: HEPN domain-containing protein [Cyanobacteria bacterium P01_D01_bin.115]